MKALIVGLLFALAVVALGNFVVVPTWGGEYETSFYTFFIGMLSVFAAGRFFDGS